MKPLMIEIVGFGDAEGHSYPVRVTSVKNGVVYLEGKNAEGQWQPFKMHLHNGLAINGESAKTGARIPKKVRAQLEAIQNAEEKEASSLKAKPKTKPAPVAEIEEDEEEETEDEDEDEDEDEVEDEDEEEEEETEDEEEETEEDEDEDDTGFTASVAKARAKMSTTAPTITKGEFDMKTIKTVEKNALDILNMAEALVASVNALMANGSSAPKNGKTKVTAKVGKPSSKRASDEDEEEDEDEEDAATSKREKQLANLAKARAARSANKPKVEKPEKAEVPAMLKVPKGMTNPKSAEEKKAVARMEKKFAEEFPPKRGRKSELTQVLMHNRKVELYKKALAKLTGG